MKCIVLDPVYSKAHAEGDIHIHDLDFYTLTTTCCQIDIVKLFKGGFCTGHGFLREPNDIASYSALACIAIQSNQNDQHGGQSIPNFDYGMAPGVRKTYRRGLFPQRWPGRWNCWAAWKTARLIAKQIAAEVRAKRPVAGFSR